MPLRQFVLCPVLLWLLFSTTSAQPSSSVIAIRTLLDNQVAAWNRGDLEGFMNGYWRSPNLTFISGATVTKGWEAVRARYQQRYQAEGRAMGTLGFQDLVIEMVGPRAALVHGRWQVTLPEHVLSGRFTLLIRRLSEGWRIVYDHTS
jgi:hypothetical protein